MSHKIIGQTIKKVAHLNEHVLILLDNNRVAYFYPRRAEYSDDYIQEMDVHNVEDLKYEFQYELGLITEEERDRLEEEEIARQSAAYKKYQLDNIRNLVKNNGFTAEEIFNS